MLKEERFAKILEITSKDGRLQFDTMAILLGVSDGVDTFFATKS